MKKSHHRPLEGKGRINQLMCWDNWLSICGKKTSQMFISFQRPKYISHGTKG